VTRPRQRRVRRPVAAPPSWAPLDGGRTWERDPVWRGTAAPLGEIPVYTGPIRWRRKRNIQIRAGVPT